MKIKGPGGPTAPPDTTETEKAGKLTPKQAVDKLMDLAVADGPAAKLPRKVQDKLRGELEDLLRSDPYLAGKVRRVGVPGGDDE